MANLDRPSGFKPVKHLSGSPWNGKANVYYLKSTYATAVFIGDAVKLAGSADATGMYPSIERAAAGDMTIVGVVIGFGLQPEVMGNPDNPNMKYRLASVAMYALVVDDPFVIFEVQEDSTGNDIDADMVGLNTNLVAGAGSTVTGLSGMELDSSDTATATTGQLRILRAVNRPDNELGANCKWEVLIVEHAYREQPTVVDI
jgi:hypothetical protein